MFSTRTIAALALACASSLAAAQSPWYAGICAGQAKTGHELVANRESTFTGVVMNVRTDFDDKDSAWKAFGGYRFNDMIAVELNYADLGSHRMFTTMQGGDPVLPASILVRRKIAGFGADLLLSAPLGAHFTVFARAGAFRSTLEADATLDGNIVFTNGSGERSRNTTADETVLHYGLGGEWWLRRNVALRLEWERYQDVGKRFEVGGTGTTGEANTDVFSLGVVMRF